MITRIRRFFKERKIICKNCGHNKFNTVIQNEEWKCRKCGEHKLAKRS